MMNSHRDVRLGRSAAAAAGGAIGLAITLALGVVDPATAKSGDYCSRTAKIQAEACGYELRDDLLSHAAICTNIADEAERDACHAEIAVERSEGKAQCAEQETARRDVCAELGEGRYDPDFDPANFDADPRAPMTPNPYWPLAVGNHWEFDAPDEHVSVTVLDETKSIEGVQCLVVNDVVTVDGLPVEDTDDWVAHAKNGDVYYCGEEVKDFERFPGDVPVVAELVAIDGSFKVGRDGNKPGIFLQANPIVGALYRQEYSIGNAEDVARVLSTTYGYGLDADLDTGVPAALAGLLCANDCLVTLEWTPIEPDAFARKYYAPGVGVFLEVPLDDPTNVLRLTACNVDPRCATLP